MYQRIVVYTKNNKWRVGCIALIAALLGAIALLIWFGVVTRWPKWMEFKALFQEEPVPVVAISELTPEATETFAAPTEKATSTPTLEPTIVVTFTAVATYTQVITSTELVTLTVTPEPTATDTPLPTATVTPVPTHTATPTPEPSATSKPTRTPSPVPTDTLQPTSTATATQIPRPSPSSTSAPTATLKPTLTLTPEPSIESSFEVLVSSVVSNTEAQLVVFAVNEENIQIAKNIAESIVNNTEAPYILIVGATELIEQIVMTTTRLPSPSPQPYSPLTTPEVHQPTSPLPTTGPYQPQSPLPVITHSVEELMELQLQLQREKLVSQLDLFLNQGYKVILVVDPEFLLYEPYSRLYKLYTHTVYIEK